MEQEQAGLSNGFFKIFNLGGNSFNFDFGRLFCLCSLLKK